MMRQCKTERERERQLRIDTQEGKIDKLKWLRKIDRNREREGRREKREEERDHERV